MGISSISSRNRTEYINVDPDYTKCPNCKKLTEDYKEWYQESYNNNPDPSVYTILDHRQIGPFLVLKVVYDNIKEEKFERVKIMVLVATPIDLLKMKKLDPHFSDGGIVVARFEPTNEGWSDAIHYAEFKNNEE